MKRADWVIISILLLAALFLSVPSFLRKSGPAVSAEIYTAGELYQSIPLDGGKVELVVETANGYNHIVVEDGSARMISADCGGQECVKTGAVHRPGEMIACLPHRLSIKITGESGDGYDAVAG